MWVQYGEPEGTPLVLYDYDPSRSAEVPKRLLEGFQGYLHTDGYEGYSAVGKQAGITHIGCWAHARRKFDEALKGQGKNKKKGKKSTKVSRAQQGLALIQKLYAFEKQAKGMTVEERRAFRQEHSEPWLEKMRKWLDESLPLIPPQSLTGIALSYLDKQWPKLVRFPKDGRIRLDTNLVENAIRPFVVGRKGWLFSDSVQGAEASANLYSLVETAKASGLEPYAYLKHIFTELPKATTVEEIEALLPFNIDCDEFPAYVKRKR
jgi:transposase